MNRLILTTFPFSSFWICYIYTLVISRIFNEILKDVCLIVMPQVTPFDFGEEILNAGDTVSLTCTVGKGDLPLKIHWQLNNKPLNTGNGLFINRNGKRISVLSIENVQHEHIGNYTCVAENEAGQSSHSAILNVNGIFWNIIEFQQVLLMFARH